MAENATIARPYARAAFDHARGRGSLPAWSDMLAAASNVIANPAIHSLLTNPDVTSEQLADLVIDASGGTSDETARNFVRLLADNHRLGLLPEIAAAYDQYRADFENVADVTVVSAAALNEAQRARLEVALRKRLGREVRMSCDVDPALIGGAVIKSGDLVIDGSLQARLARLEAQLES